MSAIKHSDLINFLSCFPSVLSKSAPYDAAEAGFVDNGMVNSKLFSYPDLHTLIGICNTVKFTTEVDMIDNKNFNNLYKEQLRVGQLTDTFMKRFGFLLDINYEVDCVMHVS